MLVSSTTATNFVEHHYDLLVVAVQASLLQEAEESVSEAEDLVSEWEVDEDVLPNC